MRLLPRLPLLLCLCSLSARAAPLLLSGVAECSTDPGDPQLSRGSASCSAGVARCATGDTTVGVAFVNYNGANSSIGLCVSPSGGSIALVGGAYTIGPPHGQHCEAYGDGSCKSFQHTCGSQTLFSLPQGGGFIDGVWSWCFGAAAASAPVTGLAHCRAPSTPYQEGYPAAFANVSLGDLQGFCESRKACGSGLPSTLYQNAPDGVDSTVLCCSDAKLCPPYTPFEGGGRQ